MTQNAQVVIIGAGFCGLAAAFELSRRGIRTQVLERDSEIGGLAGSFLVGEERLEKFYHHWFTNDVHVTRLAEELGTADRIVSRPTRTGMYFAHRFLKLSSPLDLLRFTPLKLADRIRLGLLALRARRVRDWMALENRTAADWLRQLGGEEVYRVVWEPLLRGKFGNVADEISAVWFWNKLKLRGGSRGKGGQEQLAYYRGGFAALADKVADAIRAAGGSVRTDTPVTGLAVEDGRISGVLTPDGHVPAQAVILTAPLPVAADLLAPHVPSEYEARLRRIRYLANVCVVLELDRSLSETYWLNVNDPGFPFVGVIEHTNFEPASSYNGRHIVYLSKYLSEEDPLYRMSDERLTDFTFDHLRRMFPELSRQSVLAAHVWRAQYSQPIVERGYSSMIPSTDTPIDGLYLASMAQIYPEDRGTNYAIQQGRASGARVAERMLSASGNAEVKRPIDPQQARPGQTRPAV
jgi:protoporphyrinogen oxidase